MFLNLGTIDTQGQIIIFWVDGLVKSYTLLMFGSTLW